MKRIFVSICMSAVVFAMTSCHSSKEVTPLSSMNGAWDIVEINGSAVVTPQGESLPFIGFDTATGKVYGNSGCNRMMGAFDLNVKAGTISLDKMGSTRMMCPDMTLEQNVLTTLALVKGYKKMGKGHMALCNASGRPVMILTKKVAELTVKDLKGEWNISEVNDETVPAGLENQPFIAFDLKEERIHGNAGCNLINGGFKTEEGNELSISFPAVAATMMACPDMELEGKILGALNKVKSFGKLAGGGIGLYDADNTLVLVLTKK